MIREDVKVYALLRVNSYVVLASHWLKRLPTYVQYGLLVTYSLKVRPDTSIRKRSTHHLPPPSPDGKTCTWGGGVNGEYAHDSPSRTVTRPCALSHKVNF